MNKHEKKFNSILKGKTIKNVRYLTKKEMEDMGWHRNPLCIFFTDGSILLPQTDDEGNDGGAMWYQEKDKELIIYTT